MEQDNSTKGLETLIDKWQGPALGARSYIKEGYYITKIGAINIFGGNQLRFQISAQLLFIQLRYG